MKIASLRTAGAVAAATLCAGALAGCGGGVGVAPSQSASIAATPTSLVTSATPTPTLSVNPEEAAVRTLIGKTLYETQDAVASDYNVPIDTLHQVMTGRLVDERMTLHQKYREAGLKQTGKISSVVLSLTGARDAFVVRACVNTSQRDLIDKAGKSRVAVGGPTKVLHEFQVVLDKGTFKATSDEPVEATC